MIFGFFLCALLPSFCFLIFQQGLGYFLIFLAALIGSDTMAFLLGSLFGKRLIAKELSPAKTWEGSLGGLAGAVILGLVFCYIFLDQFSIVHWGLFFLLLSLVGQAGDLLESSMKRQAGVKDSGQLLPGHGGVLDRLDSLYFSSPLMYIWVDYMSM